MFRWLHSIGAVFILLAAILLLITTISAPVIGDIAIMKVMLTNQTDIRHSSLTFGTFGHCALDVPPVTTDQDWCSKKTIGYKIADIMSQVDGTSFNFASTHSTDGLTDAFILAPIACGLAFIAAIFAFGGFFGSVVGIIVALLAWVINLAVMAIMFTVFGVSSPPFIDHVA
jgi:SUR7/PalI family